MTTAIRTSRYQTFFATVRLSQNGVMNVILISFILKFTPFLQKESSRFIPKQF